MCPGTSYRALHQEEKKNVFRCCNGLEHSQQWQCYLQGPGLKSHTYDQWSVSPVTGFLHSTIPMLRSVTCAPMNLLKAIKGTFDAPNQKKLTQA